MDLTFWKDFGAGISIDLLSAAISILLVASLVGMPKNKRGANLKGYVLAAVVGLLAAEVFEIFAR